MNRAVVQRNPHDGLLYDRSSGAVWAEAALVNGGNRVLPGAAARLPLLASLLDGPALALLSPRGQLAYSVLANASSIAPHCGPSNEMVTCHLGLALPTAADPGGTKSAAPPPLETLGLRVGGEARQWAEGAWLCFEDSFEHEAWNRAEGPRVVLLLNLRHPSLVATR